MSNPSPEERNSKNLAFIVICTFIITVLMRGVNTRFDVPHILYIGIAAVCAVVGLVGYIGFLYCKMFKPLQSELLPDGVKIIILGVLTYFIVSFCIGVLVNQ